MYHCLMYKLKPFSDISLLIKRVMTDVLTNLDTAHTTNSTVATKSKRGQLVKVTHSTFHQYVYNSK
jgi:hypothetical protein